MGADSVVVGGWRWSIWMSLEAADGVDWSSGPDGVGGCGWPRSLFHSQTKLGFGEAAGFRR